MYTKVSFRQLEKTKHTSISIEARIANYRSGKKISFALLKGNNNKTVQAIINSDLTNIFSVPPESILTFYGTLQVTPTAVKSADYKHIELVVTDYKINSEAATLPFLIKDIDSQSVLPNLKMQFPWLTHRAPTYQKIMELKSIFLKHVQDYLHENEFLMVQTPKIVSGASESGASVFKLNYFGQEACLAQSPQLFKQMLINSDYSRVYEIGPIFRAENSQTPRHLCEFTGLDIEMVIDESFTEIIQMGWYMLTYALTKLGHSQLQLPEDPLMITFADGVKLLAKHGYQQSLEEDISTVNEKKLGEIVKHQYKSDLFVLTQYPVSARPFYTQINPVDSNFTESFDFILCGLEISSGAQRINDYIELKKSIQSHKIEGIDYYLESFRFGSWKHGGFGIGVERVISCYLNLNNVQMVSYCPRTPDRLEP